MTKTQQCSSQYQPLATIAHPFPHNQLLHPKKRDALQMTSNFPGGADATTWSEESETETAVSAHQAVLQKTRQERRHRGRDRRPHRQQRATPIGTDEEEILIQEIFFQEIQQLPQEELEQVVIPQEFLEEEIIFH
jgi:hypothetical protein